MGAGHVIKNHLARGVKGRLVEAIGPETGERRRSYPSPSLHRERKVKTRQNAAARRVVEQVFG